MTECTNTAYNDIVLEEDYFKIGSDTIVRSINLTKSKNNVTYFKLEGKKTTECDSAFIRILDIWGQTRPSPAVYN